MTDTATFAPYCRVTEKNVGAFRKRLPAEPTVTEMAELFRVLGNATRVRILAALKDEPLCVSCLSKVLGAEQSAVSQQLKVLRHNKLVKYRKEGKLTIYELNDHHIDELIGIASDHVTDSDR